MADQPLQDRKGIVVVEVLEARLPRKDQVTDSDGYVKVSVVTPDGTHEVGQTKVIYDKEYPVFNHTAKADAVSIKSTIFFELFDKDFLNQNDYIASVYIPIRRLLSENNNGKPVTLDFPNGWLKVSLTWLAGDEHNCDSNCVHDYDKKLTG